MIHYTHTESIIGTGLTKTNKYGIIDLQEQNTKYIKRKYKIT